MDGNWMLNKKSFYWKSYLQRHVCILDMNFVWPNLIHEPWSYLNPLAAVIPKFITLPKNQPNKKNHLHFCPRALGRWLHILLNTTYTLFWIMQCKTFFCYFLWSLSLLNSRAFIWVPFWESTFQLNQNSSHLFVFH